MDEVLKILLIEDSQTDADLVEYELDASDLRFVLTTVHARDEFVDALRLKPDIILSDYALPAFDGLTAFHIKREMYPEIPFIIVSGTIGEEIAVELIKAGVTDYALKDKLFALCPKIKRGLKEAKELKLKMDADEQLRSHCKNLLEIAFLQSHQVRAPVAQILGLFNIFNFDNLNDRNNVEILHKLKDVAESLDKVIHEIVKKTNSIAEGVDERALTQMLEKGMAGPTIANQAANAKRV